MKNILHILVLSLIVMPIAASATTFEKPERDLTPAELKLGSIYRGCIGFHCLEDSPFLEVGLGTSDGPCRAGDETFTGDTFACLTASTNAREGIIVLMAASSETLTCLEEVSGGMEGTDTFKRGCANILEQETVMKTQDQADKAFGRLKLSAGGGIGTIKLLSVIAY